MKYLILFFFIIFTLGCSNRNGKLASFNPEIPNQEPKNDFEILGSGKFWNELDEGDFEIIKFNSNEIDTADKKFGINSLGNDAFIYLKIHKQTTDEFSFKEDTIYGTIDKYILLDKSVKKEINTITPFFNDYFSSPKLIKDKLYYWGMQNVDSSGIYNIYACELNLTSRGTTKKLLLHEEITTDNRAYFCTPFLETGKIVFQLSKNQKWYFSKELN